MSSDQSLISPLPKCATDGPFEAIEAFVVDAEVGRRFVGSNEVRGELDALYSEVNPEDANDLMIRSFAVSKLLRGCELPSPVIEELKSQLERIEAEPESLLIVYPQGTNPLDSPLRANGIDGLTNVLQKFYSDHYTNGLIHLSEDPTYDPDSKLISLVVQKSETVVASGIALSYEPKSKADNFVVVFSTWGQAEDILRRTVGRDEFWYHKHSLGQNQLEPVFQRVGEKEFQLLYDPESHRLEHLPLSRDKSRRCSLEPDLAQQLAMLVFEQQKEAELPIELSWCTDGEKLKVTGIREVPKLLPPSLKFYKRLADGDVLISGKAASHAVAKGRVRIIRSRDDLDDFKTAEILVSEETEPDWEPGFRRAAAIVTSFDRRVSHSTILAREMGIPAVLEAVDCTKTLTTGQTVTVSCCEGEVAKIYAGEVEHRVEEFSIQKMPTLKTQLMVNLSMPERALATAQLPWAGAGLIRSEFMIGGWVKVHPNALLFPDRLPPERRKTVERLCGTESINGEFFVKKMSQAVGLFAGAFWPRPITIRLSDFKSNEYARLIGGETFEPKEKNSMLGWRGASRYLHEDYRDAFNLELEAIKRVKSWGFSNVKILVPFCRTPEEGEEVLSLLEAAGLRDGEEPTEVWCMAELPSNVFLAQEFAELFDGMSIGSSDLTSLTLGVARNAEKISEYFDEMHPGMLRAYETIIDACHSQKKPVSFCGQVASEDPEFAALLTEMGVDILSLAPDALRPTLLRLGAGS